LETDTPTPIGITQTSAITRKFASCFFWIAVAATLLILHRAAWHGSFQPADLSAIGSAASSSVYTQTVNTLLPGPTNGADRPLALLWCKAIYSFFGLTFAPYIAALLLLHVVMSILVWLFLRRLGFDPWPSMAATLLFALNLAITPVLWQPGGILELGCGVICLAALLAWVRGWGVASFILFALAWRFSDTALLLPVVLVLYEWLIGEQRYRRVVPFLALMAWYGLSAIYAAPLGRIPWSAALRVVHDLLAVKWAWLLLLFVPLATRDRRAMFALASLPLLLVPLFLLSRPPSNQRLYLPLVALCIIIAALATRFGRIATVVFLLVWMPFNYGALRRYRTHALKQAALTQPFLDAIPHQGTSFRYEQVPATIDEPTLAFVLRHSTHQPQVDLKQVKPGDAISGATFLGWDPATRHATVWTAPQPLPGTVTMDGGPSWIALEKGWGSLDGPHRWAHQGATARLHQPSGARQFKLELIVADWQATGMKLHVLFDGQPAGALEFSGAGRKSGSFTVEPKERDVEVTFETEKPSSDGLAAALISFGFEK
jgi:hypothetical protein